MGKDIFWFETIGLNDLPVVGGKNAGLGVLTHELAAAGISVPPGFALGSGAYRTFIAANGIEREIARQIARLHEGKASLAQVGQAIRARILAGRMPGEVSAQIKAAYAELARRIGTRRPAVAVRSSATAEDLPGASFAGQLESFLNLSGKGAVTEACQRCFASLFTDRAIAYREAKGFDHMAVAVAVGVQQMVRSDRAGSGVIFTLDPDSGFPEVVTITATWGLGETIVQGEVEPDRAMVFKPLLDSPGARPIIARDRGAKKVRLVHAGGGGTRLVPTSPASRRRLVLDDDEVLQLARWATAIERHYRCPMDIEWAKDGRTGQLHIVQARPETVHSTRSRSRLVEFHLDAPGAPILAGAAIGTAIAAGPACVLREPSAGADLPAGAILVATNTDPDWVPLMKRAAGIITDHGGPTSHAAIVCRELGIPAIVGTGTATATVTSGQPLTIDCASGERGLVHSGALPFTRSETDVGALPPTRTAVMVNAADPAAAFTWWQLPAGGVGLARMEFIITNIVRAHPMALLHPERTTGRERDEIRRLCRDHASPAEFFIDTLARGIARLATPWYPHPAIVRLSDFKSNEYASLLGGRAFEPEEENPMLGFRGASRYYDPRYAEGFALECRALKRVREELGFANVIVMVPFCRTPAEADRVLAEMAKNGLERGANGLQVYMMCEIPANVIRAAEFAHRFDGFSIGSNDLTQLLLGVDRDSDILAGLFDERDPAVLAEIAEAIAQAHKAGIRIGLCGQAPSNHPDFAEFLIRQGIDSISLNPDSFIRTVPAIAAAEQAILGAATDIGRPAAVAMG